MIHELIDPKKKTNRASPLKSTKNQDLKTNFEETNFEASDSENKGAEASDFIPPWLKNSLGLSQRNNLRHAPSGSDQKPPKLSQKSKEPSQHEFDPLKNNTDVDCIKKVGGHFDILPQDSPQDTHTNQGLDDVEAFENSSNKTIPLYWNLRQKHSETGSSSNGDQKSLSVASKMTNDVVASPEAEKFNDEEKLKLKFMKQKNKLKKRLPEDTKLSDYDKNEMNFLVEMKTRETLDKHIKGDIQSISSEVRHLENKLMLFNTKHDTNSSKLSAQEHRLLQDVKSKSGNLEESEKMLGQTKEVNVKEPGKNSDFSFKNYGDKKRDDRDDKSIKGSPQKYMDDEKTKVDKESLLSTDDERDIKKFSEFLSNNKNLEEKRKCLEEVRNYFEKKRKSRLSKRRFLEEEKMRQNAEGEKKEDHSKDKAKSKDSYRGKKSKFALCDEEIVEKAVDEALQKFVELYHFRVSPNVMGNMKKNILQAIASNPLDGDCCKLNESLSSPVAPKKSFLEKEREEKVSYQETEKLEQCNKEIAILPKDVKRKTFKNVYSSYENSKDYDDINESEKLRRLRKEFDNFLTSVQGHIDVTDLKLQSIILEKEEQAPASQNVQFVYNFTKKSLESERTDLRPFKEVLDSKTSNDINTQTEPEVEPYKRNVKVQALELKNLCEQYQQTDEKILFNQDTQTDNEGITMRELKELKSCDVSPGLYRMVKSKEVGKFYLYPEELESSQTEIIRKNYSLTDRNSKGIQKGSIVNVLSKDVTRERISSFKERIPQVKVKKSKNEKASTSHIKIVNGGKKNKKGSASENSLSCLYFKNFEKQGSESSKKEGELSDDHELELERELELEPEVEVEPEHELEVEPEHELEPEHEHKHEKEKENKPKHEHEHNHEHNDKNEHEHTHKHNHENNDKNEHEHNHKHNNKNEHKHNHEHNDKNDHEHNHKHNDKNEHEHNHKRSDKNEYRLTDKNEHKVNDKNEFKVNDKNENKFNDKSEHKQNNKNEFKFNDKNEHKQNDKNEYELKDKNEYKFNDKSEHKQNDKNEFKFNDKNENKFNDKSEHKQNNKNEFKFNDKNEHKQNDKNEYELKDKTEPKLNDKNEPKLNDKNEPKLNDKNEPKLNDKNEPKLNDKNEPKLNDKNEPKLNDKNEPKLNDKNEPKLNDKNEPKFNEKNEPKFNEKNEHKRNDKNEYKHYEKNEREHDEANKVDNNGFFWFWNGEKISPGCDLKTHVENLLKEKLKQITDLEIQNHFKNNSSLKKNESEPEFLEKKDALDTYNLKNSDPFFSFEDPFSKSAVTFSETTFDEKHDEQKKQMSQSTMKSGSQEKSVKNVGIQNSDIKPFSLSLSKTRSRIFRGKVVKRNVVIKPARSRSTALKKAEDIIKAVQVLKKTKYKMENPDKDNSSDLESILDGSISSSLSKNETDNHFSLMLGPKDSIETEDLSNIDIKSRFKKSNCQVDREVQYEKDDAQSIESQDNEVSVDCSLKQFNLIENVLSRVSQRERENLWNDVRDLIKNKIGKDINDEGAREVCIEIEQDLFNKNKQGKKHAVLAKGHYTKNEGDVEVEIDLTLDDLARIVRQRQKKIRRRALQDQSKDFISSSSGQSDLTRDEIRRYQKYLRKFAAMEGNMVQKKESKSFKKNKCN